MDTAEGPKEGTLKRFTLEQVHLEGDLAGITVTVIGNRGFGVGGWGVILWHTVEAAVE